MNFLPDAITETLQSVNFDPETAPMRNLPEDEAEYPPQLSPYCRAVHHHI